MARHIGRWVLVLIGIAVVVAAIGVLFVYSGFYSVSATYKDPAPVVWLFSTTMDRSVEAHAASIKTPALTDPAMIRSGGRDYREDCVMCHGAPGVRIADVGRGLNPDPPELTEAANDWKPKELFWIVKNGVRMTGMPAWGVTHSDKEIWAMTAFTKRLPKMSHAEYETLTRETQKAKSP